MIRVVHPGSWVRILTVYPSRIQGSKRHRIPDQQHCKTVITRLEGVGDGVGSVLIAGHLTAAGLTATDKVGNTPEHDGRSPQPNFLCNVCSDGKQLIFSVVV